MISEKRSLLKTSLFYSALTLACAFVYFLINQKGNLLFPFIVQATISVEKPSTHSALFHFLLALVFIITVTRLMGLVSKKLSQPPVIGEILGGILLGPSFLGLFFPQLMAFIFPVNIIPMINTIAQLGIILYMYFVGLEIDLASLKKKHTPQ